jgi:hypothetical protein
VRHQQRRPAEDVPAVGPVPAGVQALELGGELLPVGLALGEEELELELVAQPHRLGPAVGGVVEQDELGDRAVDEVVDRAVAVERGHEVLAGLDRVHRLQAAVVRRHDTLVVSAPSTGGRRARCAASSPECGRPRLVEVAEHGLDDALHLGERQRAVPDAEQRERDERGRRRRA